MALGDLFTRQSEDGGGLEPFRRLLGGEFTFDREERDDPTARADVGFAPTPQPIRVGEGLPQLLAALAAPRPVLPSAEVLVADPLTGVPRPLGPFTRARLARGVERSLAAPRSFDPQPGEVLPTPAADVSTTASFPLVADAQQPILAGSRDDPWGFVRPVQRAAFGGSPSKAGLRGFW